MSADRRRQPLRNSRLVMAAANGEHPAGDLCRVCVEVLRVAGASVIVMSDALSSPLSSSDPVAARLEDLQLSMGEGPSIDAFATGRGVFEPDLATPRQVRWLAFGPEALAAGANALFAFPLRVGGVRLGALTLYQAQAGELSADQHADAQTMANVVAHTVLALQARVEPGTLSPYLEILVAYRAELHQASGMVSVQLGTGVGQALVRLRAHSYATDRTIADVATDVVAGRLHFDQ